MMITYDSPLKGQTHIKNVREQIQEDIRTYLEAQFAYDDESGEAQELCDHVCQIVVDNFKTLEKE